MKRMDWKRVSRCTGIVLALASFGASTVRAEPAPIVEARAEPAPGDDAPLKVVTTLAVLKDLAQDVGGDRVEVQSLSDPSEPYWVNR